MSSQNAQHYEPTLGEVMADLWRAKQALALGAVIGLIMAALFIGSAVPQYRALMLIGPAERSMGPDINALLPDNSSFAVQYLVNTMGSAQSTDFLRYEHILRGPTVASRLLKDEKIREGYSKAKRFVFGSGKRKDDIKVEDFSAYLNKTVAIEPVSTTPLRRLVYQHPEREFSEYLLKRIQEEADNVIREEIRGKTHDREVYLQNALVETQHPDHRRALTSLLMEQQHVRMILAMDEPLAAIVAEPSLAGLRPYWPKKSIVFGLFMMAGMLLSYMVYRLRGKEQE